MTLEKVNEDQSKYYFSYPKQPVLDIKWEYHDINAVEWTNIPKIPPLHQRFNHMPFINKTLLKEIKKRAMLRKNSRKIGRKKTEIVMPHKGTILLKKLKKNILAI